MAYIKLFKELWRFCPQKLKVVFALTLHIVAYISMLLTPFVFGKIIETFSGQTNEILSSLRNWFAVWIGLWLWFQIGHRWAQSILYSVAYRSKQNFLNFCYSRVAMQPLSWHSNHHSGDTISRINKGGDAISNFTVFQFRYTESFTLFWGPIVALSFLSWKVSAITLFIVILSILVMWRFDKLLVVKYREINETDHKVSATVFDYISNIRTIITLRLANKTGRELDRQIEKGYKPYVQAEVVLNQSKWTLVSLGVVALEVAVIYFYIWDQLNGNAAINTAQLAGNVSAMFLLLQQISRSYMSIASDYQQLLAWQTDLESSTDIRSTSIRKSSSKPQVENWQSISVKNLSFGYQTNTATLVDVSFQIERGQRVALIGESGSGKSSLLALLRNLYPAEKVHLQIDNTASNNLVPLAQITTLIPQEPEIFEDTIRFNLTVGIEYTEAQIAEALELARFDTVVNSLPNGIDTDVREKGVTLSGGEKQRLALARGILAAGSSSIILLDEPTSSVDSQNEAAILDNLMNHFQNATIISSVHRLNLLQKFDHVIVLDEGRCIQSGPVPEISTKPGHLKTLLQKYS